ncbi:nucleotide triphosphate diphosphatase NUDT15 [Azospirillum sp. ST 5-10]|uniref:nucleotide triphosphate diphosphatase NUDT15 n=1 Tax=unclassified Azospirillum TaxID=2630922 RepID=UPI003F4A5B5B
MTAPTTPHPVAGVSLFLLRADGSFLMMRRAGSHGAGCWALPGGKIDSGETISQACARECLEETGVGVRAEDVRIGPATNDMFPDLGRYFVNLFCSVAMPDGQSPRIMEPTKATDIAWARFDALPAPLFAPLHCFLSQPSRPPFAQPDTPPSPVFERVPGGGAPSL